MADLRASRVGLYAAAVTVGFLLFCFYLKWQPWHSRLHLPLFVLAAPFIAIGLTRVLGERHAAMVGGVLLVTSLPWVLANKTRPLVGDRSVLVRPRVDHYFTNRSDLRDPYLGAAGLLASEGCADVGLLIGSDGWEYPLWKMLKDETGRDVRVRHVGVSNVSATRPEKSWSRSPRPCALVMVEPVDESIWRGPPRGYALRWRSGPVSVFLSDGAGDGRPGEASGAVAQVRPEG